MLVGGFYVSLGLFSSVLTKNQIIAAVLCFALIFLAFSSSRSGAGFSTPTPIPSPGFPTSRCRNICKTPCMGIFDTRPIVFYVTMTAFMLMLTKSILDGRRLKS